MNTFATRFTTDVNTFDIKKLNWKISSSSVGKGNQKFPIFRAIPFVRNEQGEDSPLLLQTDKIFTFGLKESEKLDGNEGFDYSLPLSMTDINGATAHQSKFIKVCTEISNAGKEFLLKNKDTFSKDWIAADLRKLSILWYGKDVENKRPTLYAKLPANRKGEFDCKFLQPFLNKNREVITKEVNPLLYRNVQGNVKCLVKIDNIFIGSKVSFQVKLESAIVFPKPVKEQLITLDASDLEGLVMEENSDDDTKEEPQETTIDDDDDGDDNDDKQDDIPTSSPKISIPRLEPREAELPKPRRGKRSS